MTTTIIMTFCLLLLVAYVFDLSASRTKIPSVILLLLLGWLVKQVSGLFDFQVPSIAPLLPVLGTIGLILIVLEGSLELQLNRSKLPLVATSSIGAVLSIMVLAFILCAIFKLAVGGGTKEILTNVIPLCVISSAIAIPSVRSLSKSQKEFIIYESSVSDIAGVLFFNFVALNDVINVQSFGRFGLQLLIVLVISFVFTILLAFLLRKIDHHVKFVPIILLIVLIYAVSKVYHLPGLVFILIFGLSIGNLDEFKQYKWVERLQPEVLDLEVKKFKELVGEAAFLIRAMFFLVFGYLIESEHVLNVSTLAWAFVVVGIMFFIRALQLKLSRIPLFPLLFVAPRGLITILLFLSIPAGYGISLVNQSLVIQVILLTVFIMMIGLIFSRRNEAGDEQ